MSRIESLPLVRDIVVRQGATWKKFYIYKPGGIAMDFTGWTAAMQIRDPHTSLLLAEITTDALDGIVLGGATAGGIDLTISAAKTALIDRDGVYDLELYGPIETIRFLQGRARISAGVTI